MACFFLCVVRTAPSHSWRNPVEQVISTLNLGLQYLSLNMDSTFEAEAKKCNSLAMLRDAAKKFSTFKTTALDSVAREKSLLAMLLDCSKLKGKKFCPTFAASDDNLDLMWEKVQKVDYTLAKDTSLCKKIFLQNPI